MKEQKEFPLLSQEGWREAPGWFQSDNPASCRFRNHPSRDSLRDPAALTQEGGFPFFQFIRVSGFLIHVRHQRHIETVCEIRLPHGEIQFHNIRFRKILLQFSHDIVAGSYRASQFFRITENQFLQI